MKKKFVVFTTLFVFSYAAFTQSVNRLQKPNVIYICSDDLGYGDLSCYGAVKITTPNIDNYPQMESGSPMHTAHRQHAPHQGMHS